MTFLCVTVTQVACTPSIVVFESYYTSFFALNAGYIISPCKHERASFAFL